MQLSLSPYVPLRSVTDIANDRCCEINFNLFKLHNSSAQQINKNYDKRMKARQQQEEKKSRKKKRKGGKKYRKSRAR